MEQVQHWCAGWNRVGYSTESPEAVRHRGSIAEAFEHVQSQLEFERDYAATDEDEQKIVDVIDEWTQVDQREVEVQAGLSKTTGGYFSVTVNGWEYWVQACYTVGCDQVEEDESELTPVPGATPTYDADGNERVDIATCGHCGRSWNDAAISSLTPVPAGRCPFEYEHDYEEGE